MLEIELSYLPVILGYALRHTHTHVRCVTPLLRNAHLISTLLLSSTLPHLFTSSFMLGPLCSPRFRPPLSLSFLVPLSALPLHESFSSHILTSVRFKTRITDIPNLVFVLVGLRSLLARSNKWRYNNLQYCHTICNNWSINVNDFMTLEKINFLNYYLVWYFSTVDISYFSLKSVVKNYC